MLRLSKLATRRAVPRLAARTSPSTSSLPALALRSAALRRQYATIPEQDGEQTWRDTLRLSQFKENARLPAGWSVRWSKPQYEFVVGLVDSLAHPEHSALVEGLGSEKVAKFHALFDDVSIDGAKDHSSLPTLLRFLAENGIGMEINREHVPESPTPHAWPNLIEPEPLYDDRVVLELPPKLSEFHNRVIVRNHDGEMFHEQLLKEHRVHHAEERHKAREGFPELSQTPLQRAKYGTQYDEPESEQLTIKSVNDYDLAEEEASMAARTGLEKKFLAEMRDRRIVHTYEFHRRISHQSGKGKMFSTQSFVLIGNGNGLVGLGRAAHVDMGASKSKAWIAAVRNLSYVDRFESRTIWTDISQKFGAVQIKMRPRPLGFGLRCSPVLHKVFRAAGISDISAKIYKSRNPLITMQSALMMIQTGHNPLGKGDGAGGHGRRVEKGMGMRSSDTLMRARGRYLEPLRK